MVSVLYNMVFLFGHGYRIRTTPLSIDMEYNIGIYGIKRLIKMLKSQ